jgi:NADH-quinone oxidoreductase subunit L
MPITAFAYLIGTLSIAGFPFFAGFFSKEEILAAAYSHNPVIFAILAFSALLTSFYMFRSWFLTFTGSPRDKARFQHAHESPWIMTIPLIILAVLAAGLGGLFAYEDNIAKYIVWGEHAAEGGHHGGHLVMAVGLCAFAFGFLGAWFVYMTKPAKYEALGRQFAAPHRVLTNRYYFDEVYLWVIKHVYYPVMNISAKVDFEFLDQKIVDGVGRLGKVFSWISSLFDGFVVDQGLVDGPGKILDRIGNVFRRMQSGLAQSYLFWMGIGLASMFVWIAYNFK